MTKKSPVSNPLSFSSTTKLRTTRIINKRITCKETWSQSEILLKIKKYE